MSSSARDAYIAGVSGSRSYPGPEGKGYDSPFQRGRRSRKVFDRRSKYKDRGDKKYQGDKTFMTKAGDAVGDYIRKGGKKAGEGIMGLYDAGAKFIGSLGANWQRSQQNKKILEDAYSDELRKSMMSDSDREFYEKYIRLGDMRSGPEAQYYYDEANKALQNAQITNRINYALGQPEFGFETTAPAAQAAFNETPEQLKERIDYSALVENMAGGLDATKTGREFLDKAYKEIDRESGMGLIGNELANYKKAEPNYGQRDVLLDMNVPATDKFLEQFDIAEGLSPMEKYLLHSRAQGKGGYEEDSEQAMIDAGFDMDYIGPITRMRIDDRTAPYLSGGTPTTSEMEMDKMTKYTNLPEGSFFTDEEGDRYISTGTGAGLSFDPGAQSFWKDEMGALQLEPKLEHPWSRSSRYAPIYKGLQSFYQYPYNG